LNFTGIFMMFSPNVLIIESQYYLLRFIFKIWVHPQNGTLTSYYNVILIVAKSIKVFAPEC